MWDLVDIEWCTGIGVTFVGDMDTKVAHEADSRVNVEPEDDSLSDEDESHMVLDVWCAEEDGGDVLRGNGGIEGEGTTWETGGGDGKGEATISAEVIDVCSGL